VAIIRPIVLHKARFVLDAFEHYGIRSFADLGGSWGVNGGYSYQAMLAFPIERAFMVDDFDPPHLHERFKPYANFSIIKGSFGLPETLAALPEVDALFLFDILLHQVSPDWNTILELYASKAKTMLIYNQQWTGSANTVRLLDLGPDSYLANTPLPPASPPRRRQPSIRSMRSAVHAATGSVERTGRTGRTSGSGASPILT
jgi:hypothetical protein